MRGAQGRSKPTPGIVLNIMMCFNMGLVENGQKCKINFDQHHLKDMSKAVKYEVRFGYGISHCSWKCIKN